MKAPRRGTGLQSRNLRAKKLRRLYLWVILVVFIPLIIISLTAIVSYLQAVQINAIRIDGVATLRTSSISNIAEQILSKPALWFFSRSTPLTYPRVEIANAIAATYGLKVKNVAVSLSGWKTLDIKITERMPTALWCEEGNCFDIDETGLVYGQTASTTADILFISATGSAPISIGSTIADESDFASFMKFLALLPALGFQPVSTEISPQEDLTIKVASSGPHLITSFDQDQTKVYEYLTTLMNDFSIKSKVASNQIDYIDLRFGNKVYYMPRGGSVVASSTKSTSTKVR